MPDPQFEIEWIDSGIEPKCPPNPVYPRGVDLDVSKGKPGCVALLTYPAKRCGFYMVKCRLCGFATVVTTAGRPDDPRSIKLPCVKPIPRPLGAPRTSRRRFLDP